jgi:Domain of unknown function (DUF4440)
MRPRVKSLLTLAAILGCLQGPGSNAMTSTPQSPAARDDTRVTNDLIALSRQKWLWMANRDMAQLETLFHAQSRFVHMGATMDRVGELEVIRSGRIEYKRADISESLVELIGDTAIVYSQLRLLAVVGGNEVTNPFSVTEVYVRRDGKWQLASMAFTRLLGQ